MQSFIQKTSKNKNIILWHCAGWFLYIIYDNLYTILFTAELRKQHQLFNLFCTGAADVVVSLFTFYSLVFCIRLFINQKRTVAVAAIVLVLILVYALSYFYIELFTRLHILDAMPAADFTRNLILSTLRFFIPFFAYALTYVLAMNIARKQSEINSLQTINNKMEDERKERALQTVQLQNAYLRSQINPHFLYNTLNFFYARALSYSDELAEGILTLSEIMRYSLQSQENKLDTVPLVNEINHIENIIKINMLRHKNNLYINFKIAGNPAGINIVPLALITIVENVFKHGEINNPEYPATISITIHTASLELYCSNKKKGGIKEPGTGIGIKNTKQRLTQVYNNGFSIETNEDAVFFTTTMKIYFNNKAQ